MLLATVFLFSRTGFSATQFLFPRCEVAGPREALRNLAEIMGFHEGHAFRVEGMRRYLSKCKTSRLWFQVACYRLHTRSTVGATVRSLEVQRVATLTTDFHYLPGHFRMILRRRGGGSLNYDLLWIWLRQLSSQLLLPAPVLHVPDQHQN